MNLSKNELNYVYLPSPYDIIKETLSYFISNEQYNKLFKNISISLLKKVDNYAYLKNSHYTYKEYIDEFNKYSKIIEAHINSCQLEKNIEDVVNKNIFLNTCKIFTYYINMIKNFINETI